MIRRAHVQPTGQQAALWFLKLCALTAILIGGVLTFMDWWFR